VLDSEEHDRAVDVALSLFLADYDHHRLWWLFLNVLSICLILDKFCSKLVNSGQQSCFALKFMVCFKICGQQSCFALKFVVWREEYDYCSLVVPPPIEDFVVWLDYSLVLSIFSIGGLMSVFAVYFR
jgi:hypothetical protein